MQSENKFQITVKTSFGLENVLAQELKSLGITELEIGNRVVTFYGDKTLLYQCNLWLRTANRIIVPIRQFHIKNQDDLYHKVKNMLWEDIFDINQTFAIDSTVFSKLFNHTKYAAFKTKDAIVDRFRDKFGKRPNVDTQDPDIRINLHIDQNNQCTISLDSSGNPLFKRGYRDSRSIAPIKEDLAAGLILLSGWDKKSTFLDLFCGSGTLLIEATMIAHNIAPNLKREEFGFFNWKNFDKQLFNKVKEEAIEQEVNFDKKIIGIDIDGRVMGMCRANIHSAGLTDKIELHKKDFKDFKAPTEKGIIVSNPPYGERIGEKVDDLYKAFGDTLKTQYSGWNAWIISSNEEALKNVGLKPSQKIKLFNGSLECKFMKYEMYQGTKKIHKLQND